jgi:hypothetical protein
MEKEDNHFVSKCYQRQWYVNHSLSCYSYDKETGLYSKVRGERNHGNNNSSEKRLNWLDTRDEKKKVSLEDHFSKQETKVSRILKSLSDKKDYIQEISNEEKIELLNFACGLVIRSPNIVHDLKNPENKKETEYLLKCNFLRTGGTLQEYYYATAQEAAQEDIRNLTLESLKSTGSDTKVFQEFLRNKFKSGTIVLINTEKSQYKLLTSNYPVIHGKNIFTKEGYDLIFPVSPTKLMLVVSQESEATYEGIKNNSADYFPFIVNTGILKNHIGRSLPFDYMVYSLPAEKFFPDEAMNKFFDDLIPRAIPAVHE